MTILQGGLAEGVTRRRTRNRRITKPIAANVANFVNCSPPFHETINLDALANKMPGQ